MQHASAVAYRRWLPYVRRWGGQVSVIAALHCATLLALPLTLIWLGTGFAAAPIAAGFALEVLRSIVRRSLKEQVRSTFLRRAALGALDKAALVPEADVDSAFWAAQLTEYTVTVSIPALLAASIASVCILSMAWSAVSVSVMAALLALMALIVCLSMWSNRRRAPATEAMIEYRQQTAAWLAAAERDAGEIYGDRAREPFLARLARSGNAWSAAEDQLERKHLQHRLGLGALFLLGVLGILRSQHIDPLHLALDQSLSIRSVSGFLLLSSGIPVAYVLSTHADSLFTSLATLRQLQPASPRVQVGVQVLPRRASRLSAHGLSFSYPSSPSRALDTLDFDVDLSRMTLILAPNGAGKTTLARLICGVLAPSAGTLQVDGLSCFDLARDEFGFVPQNPLIVDSLSIEDNVRLVAPSASREAIERLLLELGLDRPLQQLAGQLSRGQQRRIAIARAVLKAPRLLLLDEPDVWLDADGRAQLAQVLQRELMTRAVLVVSHRREWLPNEVSVIDLGAHSLVAAPRADPVGINSACG